MRKEEGQGDRNLVPLKFLICSAIWTVREKERVTDLINSVDKVVMLITYNVGNVKLGC